MAARTFAITLSIALAALAPPPLAASENRNAGETAPAGTAETRYCMRVAEPTGSRIERVRCWTRARWAEQGVDVDADWPREGVRVID